MVLEATVLVIDNSEWMRNGDYVPNRFDAQTDAVTFLFNLKTQSNPENTVSVLTMAGKAPQVLTTLTNDIGKVLSGLHTVKLGGEMKLLTGIQIAQVDIGNKLVLKHRENKNQRQRVIAFCGSPISDSLQDLQKLGKKLKKNNVAVDIISFGSDTVNLEKLEAFIASVNNSDNNSRLVSIPPGPQLISDSLIGTAILGDDVGGNFEFGVDPTLDPELAMALKMSLEEEKVRQEKSGSPLKQVVMSDEDRELQQALEMSMATHQEETKDVEMDKDDELMAIVGQLPGVDQNDPRLKDLDKKKKPKE